jgi:hypothetical protein
VLLFAITGPDESEHPPRGEPEEVQMRLFDD